MPKLALAICILWFASLFLFRTVLQWRQTGSTGIKGFHGRIGSLPWIAGTAASLGLVFAPLTPLAALFDWPGGRILFYAAPIHALGAVIALLGIGGALLAQVSMGPSWPIGVDESETTELVTDGLFAWIRNPIFSFILLSVAGFVLLVPSIFAMLAGALTALGIELQVRAVEEPYLERTHGAAYSHYAARVGRFFPGLGCIASGER